MLCCGVVWCGVAWVRACVCVSVSSLWPISCRFFISISPHLNSQRHAPPPVFACFPPCHAPLLPSLPVFPPFVPTFFAFFARVRNRSPYDPSRRMVKRVVAKQFDVVRYALHAVAAARATMRLACQHCKHPQSFRSTKHLLLAGALISTAAPYPWAICGWRVTTPKAAWTATNLDL